MDSKLRSLARTLFTWSRLERGRAQVQNADPRVLADFQAMDELVDHSLKEPDLVRTQTAQGNKMAAPKLEKRTFLDESLMKKLLQHREQIPLSSRIIRSKPQSNLPS